MKLIQIQMGDNVAVALAPVEAGEQVSVGGRTLTAAESIPQGRRSPSPRAISWRLCR